ncbi:hypothetical protein HK103_007436 [Boothiomyces macroporosus]|uniref:BTB domain-containing protein n=1 Tax=Boothiomyces macroporosus TaxID=261099 RepID=A0AAD5YAE5_9FUNG|nr:hypothetical protein HK103_007436 [Boothiomyces macroporosus]
MPNLKIKNKVFEIKPNVLDSIPKDSCLFNIFDPESKFQKDVDEQGSIVLLNDDIEPDTFKVILNYLETRNEFPLVLYSNRNRLLAAFDYFGLDADTPILNQMKLLQQTMENIDLAVKRNYLKFQEKWLPTALKLANELLLLLQKECEKERITGEIVDEYMEFKLALSENLVVGLDIRGYKFHVFEKIYPMSTAGKVKYAFADIFLNLIWGMGISIQEMIETDQKVKIQTLQKNSMTAECTVKVQSKVFTITPSMLEKIPVHSCLHNLLVNPQYKRERDSQGNILLLNTAITPAVFGIILDYIENGNPVKVLVNNECISAIEYLGLDLPCVQYVAFGSMVSKGKKYNERNYEMLLEDTLSWFLPAAQNISHRLLSQLNEAFEQSEPKLLDTDTRAMFSVQLFIKKKIISVALIYKGKEATWNEAIEMKTGIPIVYADIFLNILWGLGITFNELLVPQKSRDFIQISIQEERVLNKFQ